MPPFQGDREGEISSYSMWNLKFLVLVMQILSAAPRLSVSELIKATNISQWLEYKPGNRACPVLWLDKEQWSQIAAGEIQTGYQTGCGLPRLSGQTGGGLARPGGGYQTGGGLARKVVRWVVVQLDQVVDIRQVVVQLDQVARQGVASLGLGIFKTRLGKHLAGMVQPQMTLA